MSEQYVNTEDKIERVLKLNIIFFSCIVILHKNQFKIIKNNIIKEIKIRKNNYKLKKGMVLLLRKGFPCSENKGKV